VVAESALSGDEKLLSRAKNAARMAAENTVREKTTRITSANA
jgi:hypothetical protein